MWQRNQVENCRDREQFFRTVWKINRKNVTSRICIAPEQQQQQLNKKIPFKN